MITKTTITKITSLIVTGFAACAIAVAGIVAAPVSAALGYALASKLPTSRPGVLDSRLRPVVAAGRIGLATGDPT
jgi:hypothetical protein